MAAERKTLTQLSVPICLETLFYMLSGMVDTLMLSSVSDQAVGAVGTANTYIGVFIIMFGVISSGMIAVMSQNIGAGRPGIAYQARQLGLIFNALIGIVRVKDTAKELCEQLVEIYVAKNKKTESIITAQIKTKIILLQFILEMWEKGFVIENDKSGRNTIEKEMISYIQQNFMEKISLKEFSEQFHLSEKYISRYFKEHFHITLSQYITHLRLEHAKQLLQDTDIPVTEIAMQSGYQNVSYFIRSFKKTYGVSPLKYRKK